MPKYRYRARSGAGKLYEGILEAADEKELARILRSKGYFLTAAEAEREKKGLNAEITIIRKKVGLRELAIFCRQFATMINAGFSLVDTLYVLKDQTVNKHFRKVLQEVIEDINSGKSLSEALSKHPKIFPPLFIKMVEVGEVGGLLDDVLLRLAYFYEKEHDMRQKIKGAMAYPTLVLCFAFLAVFFLLAKVVPQFTVLFMSLGGELPPATKFLISLGDIFSRWWYMILVFIILAVILTHLYFRTVSGKKVRDFIAIRFPVIGTLFHKRIIGQFSRTLSTLVSAGVPILVSLEVVAATANNFFIESAIMQAQVSARDGGKIAEPLENNRYFPLMVTRMIGVGESTGTLDMMLEKVADFFDREVDYLAGKLTTMLEPLLIIFLGGIVGFIVISVLLPIFEMTSLVG